MLIVGPLLVILLVGLAFNNSDTYQLSIGAYSPEYSELSEDLIVSLGNQFAVQKFLDSDTCISKVKEGDTNICLYFSPNLTVDSDMENEIKIYVDYSKFNLAWMVIDTVNKQVSSTSTLVTKDLTTVMLEKIGFAQDELAKDKEMLAELATSNTDMKAGIATVKYHVDSQDLSFDQDKIGTSDISEVSAKMQDQAKYLIVDLRATLDKVKRRINDYNISSEERDEMLESIEQSENKIKTMESQFDGKDAEIQETIGEIDGYMTKLASQLRSAQTNRAEMYPEIKMVESTLASNIVEIMKIQQSFESMGKGFDKLQVKDAASIAMPIQTAIEPIASEKTHFNYLYPALIVLLVMFVSILLSSTQVVMDRNSKAFVRNLVTPVKDITFIFATYLTSLILIGAQLVVVFFVSYLFLDNQFAKNLFATGIVMYFVATLFILLGMAIGYFFAKQDAVTLAGVSVGAVMMLFSGIILPLESMPTIARQIANYNPFVIAENLVRKSLIFNYGLGDLLSSIGIIALYCAVTFGVIMLGHTLLKKSHYMKGFSSSKKK